MQAIEKVIVNLLTNQGVFYASLLTQMYRIETEKVPTLGVTIANGRIELFYNPKFLEGLTTTEARAVLEHECMHLVMEHIMRKDDRSHDQWNIATDLAINQMIDGLPKDCVNLDKFPADWKMPPKSAAEKYYDVLNRNSPKMEISECAGDDCKSGSCKDKKKGQGQGQGQPQQGKGKQKGQGEGNQPGDGSQPGTGSGHSHDPNGQPQPGNGQPEPKGNHSKRHVKIKDGNGKVVSEFDVDNTDDHGEWDQGDSKDCAKEVVKQAVKQAVDEAQRHQGHTPAGLEDYIKELLKPPVIPWQQVLRRFVAMSVKAGHKTSWKKPNRRYGEAQKGHLPARKLAITLVIDTSGSVGEADFQAFIAEIKAIQTSYKSDITIIECDAEVQKEYKLTRYKKLDTKFKGRGGTSFQPPFKYVKDKKIKTDALIYFTDLYGDFPPKKPMYPVLWVSVSDLDKAPWGVVLSIPKHTPKR